MQGHKSCIYMNQVWPEAKEEKQKEKWRRHWWSLSLLFIGVDPRPIHSTPRSVRSTAQQANNTAAEHHEQDIWRSLQTMIAAPYAAIQRRCIHIISCASSCVLYHTTCRAHLLRVWRSYTEEIHIIHCASSCVLYHSTCTAHLLRVWRSYTEEMGVSQQPWILVRGDWPRIRVELNITICIYHVYHVELNITDHLSV